MPPTRTTLLAGATGLVGRELLVGLLADASVGAVHTLGRRVLPLDHPKLTQHMVDFKALPALPPVHEVYLAIGTTIKVAGSQEAFRAVDYDANLAVAKGAFAAGARRLGLVSAMGADARSSIFYSRVKGELEDALASLGFDALVIARPSMLAGDRNHARPAGTRGRKARPAGEQTAAPLDPRQLPVDRGRRRGTCAAARSAAGARAAGAAIGRDARVLATRQRGQGPCMTAGTFALQ